MGKASHGTAQRYDQAVEREREVREGRGGELYTYLTPDEKLTAGVIMLLQ